MIKYLASIFLIVCILFVFGFSWFFPNAPIQNNQKIIDVGEEITYVVKYLAFEIGEIKLIVQKEQIDGIDTVYSAIAYINSYEGIPFVDLHQIYETKFDTKQISKYFKGSILAEDTTYTKYHFNKNKNNIRIIKGRERTNEVWTDSTLTYDRDYQDGLSLFYFARMRTGHQRKVNVPVFINEKLLTVTTNGVSSVACTGVNSSITSSLIHNSNTFLNSGTDIPKCWLLTNHFKF